MTDPQPVCCEHCGKPVQQTLATVLGVFWVHLDGNVACFPIQATYPPKGTNAKPRVSPANP